MDIREYAHTKVIMMQEVEARWRALTEPYNRSFFTWWIESNMVIISYHDRYGDDDTDDIPVKFFEIDDEIEAIGQFKIHQKELQQKRAEQEAEQKKKEAELKEAEERKLFEELKQKYGREEKYEEEGS